MTPAERSRLGAVLALLSSDKAGEVAAAAAAATRIQRASGLSWHQILQPAPLIEPNRAIDVEDDLDLLLDSIDELSGWEQRFAKSVAAQAKWTPKQIEIIRRTANKLRRMARAA